MPCPLLGMPLLCVSNQAHPHDGDVASCSRKYQYDVNIFFSASPSIIFSAIHSALFFHSPLFSAFIQRYSTLSFSTFIQHFHSALFFSAQRFFSASSLTTIQNANPDNADTDTDTDTDTNTDNKQSKLVFPARETCATSDL